MQPPDSNLVLQSVLPRHKLELFPTPPSVAATAADEHTTHNHGIRRLDLQQIAHTHLAFPLHPIAGYVISCSTVIDGNRLSKARGRFMLAANTERSPLTRKRNLLLHHRRITIPS